MKNRTTQKAVFMAVSILLFSTGFSFAQWGRGGERGERNEHEGWGEGNRHERNEYREREEQHERMERYEHRNVYYNRPRSSVSISIGSGYGYYNRPYYNPYASHYISPSFNFGFRLNLLPRGCWSMNYGGNPFYYYNGAFIRPYNDYYEIVEAPVGAEVPSLPSEARPIVIDGIRYYEINGNFFRKNIHANGEVWYRVMGKNGRLETDDYDRDDR